MNKIKSLALLLSGALLFSMLVAATPALAQSGALSVTVTGPAGAPEKDVKVVAVQLGSKKSKDKKTSAQGVALFDKLDNGVYRVVGRKEGFAPALYEFVTIAGGQQTVTLKLAAGADAKLYFEDPALEHQAAMLLQEGMKAIEAKNAAEAEKLIGQSLAINPSAADALYFQAVAQIAQKKYDQATESFKKSIAIAEQRKSLPSAAGPGGNKQVYERLLQNAQQQLMTIPLMKAQDAYQAKKYDEAITLYDAIIADNPKNGALYANKAMALTEAGRNDEALVAIDKSLELNPNDDRAKQIQKAVTARIANARREKEIAIRKQANTLITDGNKMLEYDVPGALKKFEEANQLTGEKEPVVLRQLARAQGKLKNETAAVASFKKAIELAPADKKEDYQLSLAQYYLDTKQPDAALDVLVTGAKNPEQTLLGLVAKTKNSQPAFAEAALERVIKINPDNLDACFDLGQLYYIDGKEKDARTKELLTKYVENGKDEGKKSSASDMLILVNRRSK